MTQKDSEDQLTLFAADILASPLALPGSDEAIKMTDTSGRKCLELSKLSGPLGLLEKMLLDTSLWASTRCFLTWKPKDTKQGALLFRLSPRMPTTAETDAGLWATPNSMDHLPQRSEESLKKMAEGHRKGRSLPSNLREQVDPETVRKWQEAQEPKMWPTPVADDTGLRKKKYSQGGTPLSLAVKMQEPKMWATPRTSDVTSGRTLNEKGQRISKTNPNLVFGANLADQIKMYPTPTANDFKGSGRNETMRDRLDYAVEKPDGKRVSGSLNPQFVEWLMGYPVGYTDLDS